MLAMFLLLLSIPLTTQTIFPNPEEVRSMDQKKPKKYRNGEGTRFCTVLYAEDYNSNDPHKKALVKRVAAFEKWQAEERSKALEARKTRS